MSRGRRGFGWRWSPRRLGRSLPIYRPLWASRAAVAAVALLAALAATCAARRAAFSGIDRPLPPAEAEALAARAVADVELPHWVPGEPLPAAERPPFAAPPAPPPWPGAEPVARRGGAAERLHAEGLARLADGQPVDAATALLAAAAAEPGAWTPRYHAGLALLAAGDAGRAARELDGALRTLTAAGARRWTDPALAAAETATLSAASLAWTGEDCLAGVNRARLAVAALERYRGAADVRAYDRKLPFPVLEAGIDSLHVWNRLTAAYLACDRPYSAYRERWRQASAFRETEYAAAGEEVRSGPFPAQLAACVEADDPALPCWALSNLNKVYARARVLYPRPEGGLNPLARRHAEGLAALAYNAAWLASRHDDDRPRALDALARTARLPLDPEAPVLAEIEALSRHLAPATGDYSFLARRFAAVDPAALGLDGVRSAEEVKGIAWAVSDRWIARARAGRPDEAVADALAWRPRAGPYGEALAAWADEVRQRFRRDLADEVRTRRANGDLPAAAGLYALEAGWLGEEWPPALAALGPGTLGLWALCGLAALAVAAAAWGVHRLVVVPYLLYTTDFYRQEYRRRHQAARRADPPRPFTAGEILEAERRRGG